MAPKWCVICGEDRIATECTVVIDGDPMCAAHAAAVNRGAAMMAAASGKPALCSRGCGKPTHRGLCAGRHAGGRQPYKSGERQAKAEIPDVAHAPVVATVCGLENIPPETREALGQLARSACNAFRVVQRADLPSVQRRESVGLNQRVYAAMKAARPEAIEVPVDNWKAGVNLRRRMQLMAQKEGLGVDWSRSGDRKLFYFWLTEARA